MEEIRVIVTGKSYYTKNASINESGKYPEKFGVGLTDAVIENSEELSKEVKDFFNSKINENGVFKCFNSQYPIATWRKEKYYNFNIPNDVEIRVSLDYKKDKDNKYFVVNGIDCISDFKSHYEKVFG